MDNFLFFYFLLTNIFLRIVRRFMHILDFPQSCTGINFNNNDGGGTHKYKYMDNLHARGHSIDFLNLHPAFGNINHIALY